MALAVYNIAANTTTVLYNTICIGSSSSNQPGCVHKIQMSPDNGIIVAYNQQWDQRRNWYLVVSRQRRDSC